ncbi:MAG: hypothetical protein ACXABY_09320 [Candidatus Thorarchaeota archaeon]
MPIEVPVADVEENVKHLDSLIDDRPLTKLEAQFIANERLMCANNFRYYAERYCHIQHFEGGVRKFEPNVAQNIALDLFGQLEEIGRSISVQFLKARQLGISTLCELCISHRVQFIPETNSLIGSSDPVKSTKMSKMMLMNWEKMPWWLLPKMTKRVTGELYEFGDQRSSVTVAHGSAMSGIGRGSTFQAFHLSELADFINPAENVDASLIKATHESPLLFRALESTAKGRGRGNWWHTTWEDSKKYYWRGQSRFCPVFLPWYVGTDIYPPEALKSAMPVPESWVPSELTEQHAEKAKEYVKGSELLRRHLGQEWEMPREQMFYWENERRMYLDKGELAKFCEEMPADDNEAFQSTGTTVFPVEVLQDLRENAKAPKGVYTIIGDPKEIAQRHWPSARELDRRYQPITVTAKWRPTHKPHTYQLIRMKTDIITDNDWNNRLKIWEWPDGDYDYGIGVDCGYGIGSDRSVIQVMRKPTMWRNGAQVAEWASDSHNALDMWPLLMAIGTLYSIKRQGMYKQPLIAIETAASGENLLHEVRKRGLYNHHQFKRYDRKKMDNNTNRLGFQTVGWSRAMMLDYYIQAVKDGVLDLNSDDLLNEMGNFAEDPNTQKLQATQGYHDDRLMAIGIINFCLTVDDTKGYTASLKERLAQRDILEMDPVWKDKYGMPEGSSIEQLKELEDGEGFPNSWGVDSYGDEVEEQFTDIISKEGSIEEDDMGNKFFNVYDR